MSRGAPLDVPTCTSRCCELYVCTLERCPAVLLAPDCCRLNHGNGLIGSRVRMTGSLSFVPNLGNMRPLVVLVVRVAQLAAVPSKVSKPQPTSCDSCPSSVRLPLDVEAMGEPRLFRFARSSIQSSQRSSRVQCFVFAKKCSISPSSVAGERAPTAHDRQVGNRDC